MSTDSRDNAFGVSTQWYDRVAVVSARGDLDLNSSPELGSAVQVATHAEPSALIIDLTGVGFLASVAMTVLVDAAQNTALSGRFSVVAHGPSTKRPLQLVGLDEAFPLHDDLDAALHAVGHADGERTV